MSMKWSELKLPDTADLASRVAREVAVETENVILDQMNDFVSRNLIEIEQSDLQLIREDDGRLKMGRTVKLRLKDKEYIQRIENENREMRHLLARLAEFGSPRVEK
jgi:hypothetical protein